MRPLMLIFVMLLVAAVGGASAWWVLLRGEDQVAVAEPPPPALPEFVELEPLVLPLIQEGQVTHHVTLTVVVEVVAGGKEQVLLAKRQLTDAYFSELYGLLALRVVRRQANVLPLLRRRLLVVSERLLGPGLVTSVLISEPSRRRPAGT
jgi:hypothetical protein